MADQSDAQGLHSAIERLYAAMNAVASGDVSAMKALYSHRDDVTAFYGWGGYEVGWAQVHERWEWTAKQFHGGTVSYENLSTIVTPELAYTTDIETFRARLGGMDMPTQWSNRVTHIFRLEDREWRLVHRHANRLEPQQEPGTRVRS